MTMALLSLLLGCSTAPAPAPASPVAVVVEWSSGPKPSKCAVSQNDLALVRLESRETAAWSYRVVEAAVECCTHNGGEHVGWKDMGDGEMDHPDTTRIYPVCLYR